MIPNLCSLKPVNFACDQPSVELLDVKKDALKRVLRVNKTQGDGICLFHALYNLTRTPTVSRGKRKIAIEPKSALDVRSMVFDFMKRHHAVFAKLLDPATTRRATPTEPSDLQVSRYVRSMEPSRIYGGKLVYPYSGTIEIQAFAMLANAVVYVLSIEDEKGRQQKENVHVVSRHFPCKPNGDAIDIEEAQKLPLLVLLYHRENAMPHYSWVSERGGEPSCAANDEIDDATAALIAELVKLEAREARDRDAAVELDRQMNRR